MRTFYSSLSAFLAIILPVVLLSGCAAVQAANLPLCVSYRGIPGVTQAEIDAIETLRTQTDHFVYGMNPSVEAFQEENGEIGGYSALLCDWLTELFGIRFQPALFEMSDLYAGMEDGRIDFTGDVAAVTNCGGATWPVPRNTVQYRSPLNGF